MEEEELEPWQTINSLRPGDNDTEIVFVVDVREATEPNPRMTGDLWTRSRNYEMLRPDGEIMTMSSTMLIELTRQKVLKVLYKKSLT